MTNQILKRIGTGIENLFWVAFLIVTLPIIIVLLFFDFIRERGRAYYRGAFFPLGKRPSDVARQIFVYPRQRRKLERTRQERNSGDLELQPLPLFPAELYEAFMDQCTLLCLRNCSLVSREWCRIARRRLFHFQINIHKHKAYRMVELVRSPYRSESFIPSIRDVGIFGDDEYFDVCDRVLFHLSAAGVQLQRLHTGFCHTPRLDPSWLSPLNVTELVLTNTDRKPLKLSSAIRLITSFPALQTLSLALRGYVDARSKGTGPIVDPDPKALLSPQLQKFFVTAIPPNYQLHGLDISRLILMREPDLRTLQLIVSRPNNEDVEALRVYLSKSRRLDTLVLGLLSGADPVTKVSDALNRGYFKLFGETGLPPGLRVLEISCRPHSRMKSDTISDQHQHLSSYFDQTGYASLQEIRIRVHPELYSDAKASTTVADLGILWSLGSAKLFVLETPTQANIRDISTLIYKRSRPVQE